MIDPELDDDVLDLELDEDQPASHYQPPELELHDNRSAVGGRPSGLKFNQGESKTAKHSPEYEALCCEIRQAHEQHFDLEVHLDGTFEHGNENFNVSYCGMYRKDRSPPAIQPDEQEAAACKDNLDLNRSSREHQTSGLRHSGLHGVQWTTDTPWCLTTTVRRT